MRSVLAVAGVNLRRLTRDRAALFFAFLLPVILILMLGLVFGRDYTPTIGVIDLDRGALGEDLLRRLTGDGYGIRRFDDEDDLVERVERQRIAAAVIVPDDYSERLRRGERSSVVYLAERSTFSMGLRTAVDSAVADQEVEIQAARFASRELSAGAEGGSERFDQLLELARDVRPRVGGIVVERRSPRGEPASLAGFELAAPQNLTLMVFLVSLAAASQLMLTRRLGLSRRMIATPTPAAAVIAGEALGRFLIALLQSVFIVGISALLFGVDWGHPAGALAVVIAFALVGSGAAMLIGTIVEDDSQSAAVTPFIALIVGALGGAMVPLEVMPSSMRFIAHATPHAWALDAFELLIRDGAGPTAVAPHVGVLLGLAGGLLAVATWRFRRSLTGG